MEPTGQGPLQQSGRDAVRDVSELSQRAACRTMRRRRRQVLRSIATVLLTLFGVIVLAVFMRDQQEVDACRERMVAVTAEFQRLRVAGQPSPGDVPLPRDDSLGPSVRSHLYYNWFYTESSRPVVGVCCCKHAHDRLFRPAGRHVIVLDAREGRYDLRWMREDEFARAADDLGLRVGVQP
jgi:hypothetical protein